MSYFDRGDVHVDVLLSNFLLHYRNRGLIGPLLVPSIQVSAASAKYYVISQDSFNRVDNAMRAPGARSNRARFRLTTDSIAVKEYALHDVIAGVTLADADLGGGALLEIAAANLSDLIDLEFEQQLINLLNTSGNYGTGHTTAISAGSEWDVPELGDPIGDIDGAVGSILMDCGGLPPGAKLKLAMGRDSWVALRKSPDVVERFKYVSAGPVSKDGVAALLGVDEIVVSEMALGPAQETTSLPNPISNTMLWPASSDNAVVLAVNEGVGGGAPAFGSFTALASFETYPKTVRRWANNEELGSAAGPSQFVEVSRHFQIKKVAVDTVANAALVGAHYISNTLA